MLFHSIILFGINQLSASCLFNALMNSVKFRMKCLLKLKKGCQFVLKGISKMGEIRFILHDLCQCHSTKTSHFLQRMPQTHSFTSYSFHDQVYNHPIQQPINYVVCSVEIQQCSLNIGNEYVRMFSVWFICKPSNGQ